MGTNLTLNPTPTVQNRFSILFYTWDMRFAFLKIYLCMWNEIHFHSYHTWCSKAKDR